MPMANKIYSIIAIFHTLCILPLRQVLLFLCILLPSICFAQSFSEGEALFRSDQPDLAIPMLQKSLLDGSAGNAVYNYLGIAYMQTGDTQKALNVFVEGTAVSGTDKKSLYYNAGNAAYVLRDYQKASEYFSYAIAADSAYANAYLNRGNTNVQLAEYLTAIDDYNKYLLLDPSSDQADSVRRMITALTADLEFQEVEAERLVAEEGRLQEQKERIDAEQKRLATEKAAEKAAADAEKAVAAAEKAVADAERRQRILDEVSASLQSGESTNLSAGTEGVLEYEYEEAGLE